jgi:predicted lipoprotein with Yx(FWY)xxD motif
MTGITKAVKREPGSPTLDWRRGVLLVAGSGLLFAAGAMHLDLYLTGYRTIPTIGWLFLLQIITALALALAVLVLGLLRLPGSRLIALAGALFALAVLGGYILSVWIGLFGFKEVRTTAGIVSGIIDVAAFAALAAYALMPAPARDSGQAEEQAEERAFAKLPAATLRAAGIGAAGLAVLALVLFGVSVGGASSGTSPAAASSGGGLKTTTIGGATVLTNAKGHTLYWFAPDTPTTSKCYGSCAAYWPPVTGSAAEGSGIAGQFGTIKRTDGSSQITYNRHPLYTYIGDSGPGQAHGNNINLNGGVWHEVTVSGA